MLDNKRVEFCLKLSVYLHMTEYKDYYIPSTPMV